MRCFSLVLACSTISGCANHAAVYPRSVAGGAAPACPSSRIPQLGESVSPDAARCSYNDSLGANVLRLTGKVLAEAGPGHPGRGLNKILVTVHVLDGPVRLASPGKLVAHARTTPQGDYSLSAPLKPGDYLLLAKDAATDTLLGYRQLSIGNDAIGTLSSIDIVVPLDERLQNATNKPNIE